MLARSLKLFDFAGKFLTRSVSHNVAALSYDFYYESNKATRVDIWLAREATFAATLVWRNQLDVIGQFLQSKIAISCDFGR